MNIIEYDKKYKNEFIRLNTEWLNRFFMVEPVDQDMMDRVEELIENGAMVYFAIENDKVLATCMAMPIKENHWEICKLAAQNNIQEQVQAVQFSKHQWTMPLRKVQKSYR